MSGGHWNYSQHTVNNFMKDFSGDTTVYSRFPDLAKTTHKLSLILDYVFHAIDWDLSGDSSIEDDFVYEDVASDLIKFAVITDDKKAEEQYKIINKKIDYLIDKFKKLNSDLSKSYNKDDKNSQEIWHIMCGLNSIIADLDKFNKILNEMSKAHYDTYKIKKMTFDHIIYNGERINFTKPLECYPVWSPDKSEIAILLEDFNLQAIGTTYNELEESLMELLTAKWDEYNKENNDLYYFEKDAIKELFIKRPRHTHG
jgi:hypothetical protein